MVPARAILTPILALATCALADPVVVVGRHFSLVIEPYHYTVSAFGKNGYGQLGTNDTVDLLEPTVVHVGDVHEHHGGSHSEHVISGAAGAFHTLLLTEEGAVYAAGRNDHGQLGTGSTDSFLFVKVPLPQGVRATSVAAGYAHSLVLTEDNEVYAFGQNKYGQLGDGSLESRSEPTLITVLPDAEAMCSNGTKVRSIAAGYDFSYFVLADTKFGVECDGMVFAAGMGLGGQLGTGMREAENPVPAQVAVDSVEAASAGSSHGLFLLKTGLIAMTGANFDGQLGSATPAVVATPTVMLPAAAAAGVFAGGDSSCYTGASGNQLMAMGSNRMGQLGLGNATVVAAPLEVTVLGAVEKASIGESHSLFVTLQGTAQVYATGSNRYGELGDGTQESTSEPVESVPRVTTKTSTDTMTSTITATMTTTKPGPVVTATVTQSEARTTTVTDTASRGEQAAPFSPTNMALIAVVVGGVLVGCWGYTVLSKDGESQGQGDDPDDLSTELANQQP